MGGPNLEVFKFGMYIMFPVGVMYYFGTNLESRFSVPDFWPKEGQTHTIPFEKEDIAAEIDVLRTRRLAARARRLALEQQGQSSEVTEHREEQAQHPRPGILQATTMEEPGKSQVARQAGWSSWFK